MTTKLFGLISAFEMNGFECLPWAELGLGFNTACKPNILKFCPFHHWDKQVSNMLQLSFYRQSFFILLFSCNSVAKLNVDLVLTK